MSPHKLAPSRITQSTCRTCAPWGFFGASRSSSSSLRAAAEAEAEAEAEGGLSCVEGLAAKRSCMAAIEGSAERPGLNSIAPSYQ